MSKFPGIEPAATEDDKLSRCRRFKTGDKATHSNNIRLAQHWVVMLIVELQSSAGVTPARLVCPWQDTNHIKIDRWCRWEVCSAMMFLPDPQGALRLSQDINERLADSLDAMAKAVSKAGVLSHKALTVGRSIRARRRIAPDYFARYFELLKAVEADDIPRSIRLLEDISEAVEHDPEQAPTANRRHAGVGSPEVFSWADLDPTRRQRYAGFFEAGDADTLSLLAPPVEDVERMRGEIDTALQRLDRHLPAFGAEIRVLLSEIVMCRGEERESSFAGASTFYIWGAVFMNPAAYPDSLAVLQGLVIESTHALLYGLSEGGSFLRDQAPKVARLVGGQEPDPVDETFHAAVVSARLHYVLQQLTDRRALDGAEALRARQLSAHSLNRFVECNAALGDESRFADVGCAMLQETRQQLQVSSSRAA
ncbi:aKG-HExxH-type peptide beta-hydroxylase [Jiella avicenniae]|uniref:HEXXH motif-containing putative peptide modification protein n=1 Tax=Jiella avicenniae TaxID=2907202 RepID=A0A9X1NYK1_9HYPH|nr:HEXXH motif-containing putative peptide modification protein [Jiella avicenniae]MCE7026761.1 HEXXH motif-containing putative peptide modification protein [Jiella avicenniae]